MLTFFFYCSTKISHEIFYKEGKYLFIGFLYSFIISSFFGFGPLLNQYYDDPKYLCIFKYSDYIYILLWNIGNATIIGINCILNCFWLCKSFLKKQNKKENNKLLCYIWVIRIFPFVLIVTGLIKVSFRIIGNFDIEDKIMEILGYSVVSIHNLNGFFNSLACFYFFSDVFWCCKDDDDEKEENSNGSSQSLKDIKPREEEEEKE